MADAAALIEHVGLADLHVDSFIWTRLLGYDLLHRHRRAPLGRRFFWHVDLPRALDAGLAGAIWSVTTNPFRRADRRRDTCVRNVAHLRSILARAPGVRPVRTVAEYRRAREESDHGAFIGLQGGNAVDASLDDLELVAADVCRVTLVHLTSSRIGTTCTPVRVPWRRGGLSRFGREYVRRCNELRILVDLAHAGPATFADAVAVHDPSVPLAVTHTGASGVHPHWRNLDDDQIRAVARTGGCVGVMLQEAFLGRPATVSTVADHLEHLARVGGEDLPAIGTDLDGMVTPPRDLSGHAAFPALVAELRHRGWGDEQLAKVLSANALRVLDAVRG